jgi:hypothetical protein
VCDDNVDNEKDGATVAAKLVTVDESFGNGSGVVPPPENGVVRMGVEADFLFCLCPEDHPALLKTSPTKSKFPEGESLILLTVVLYIGSVVLERSVLV